MATVDGPRPLFPPLDTRYIYKEKAKKREITDTARRAIETEQKNDTASPTPSLLATPASLRSSARSLRVPSPLKLDGYDPRILEEHAKFQRMQELYKKTRDHNKLLKERYRLVDQENLRLRKKIDTLNHLLEQGEIFFQKEKEALEHKYNSLLDKNTLKNSPCLKRTENSNASLPD